MTRALMQTTQVNVTLSLNVNVSDDYQAQLITFPLVTLTTLFLLIIQIYQDINQALPVVMGWVDTLTLTGKLLTIGFTALAFGLGVRL